MAYRTTKTNEIIIISFMSDNILSLLFLDKRNKNPGHFKIYVILLIKLLACYKIWNYLKGALLNFWNLNQLIPQYIATSLFVNLEKNMKCHQLN